jgi:hypothetical protein
LARWSSPSAPTCSPGWACAPRSHRPFAARTGPTRPGRKAGTAIPWRPRHANEIHRSTITRATEECAGFLCGVRGHRVTSNDARRPVGWASLGQPKLIDLAPARHSECLR